MAWMIEYSDNAMRDLKRLDAQIAKRIMNFMKDRIATAKDPRQIGTALVGEKGAVWRYRIGDYRAVCEIHDGKVRVLVLKVGHRRDVYRKH